MQRVFIDRDPYLALDDERAHWTRGVWPCHWVSCADAGPVPFATAYRLRFTLDREVTVRAHVSGDERYELYLDGQRIARGSERGDGDHWFFESYDLTLKPGNHVLVARTWSLGPIAPYAQMSVYPGFLFATEGDFIKLMATGAAPWEAKRLDGYTFVAPGQAWGTGANVIIDGRQFPWGFEAGTGEGWKPAVIRQPGLNGHRVCEFPREDLSYGKHYAGLACHLLEPATLPPMMEERRTIGTVRLASDIAAVEDLAKTPIRAADNRPAEQQAWNKMLAGRGSVTIPPNSKRRILIDLDEYYCAYPELITTAGQGSSVQVFWAEALWVEPHKSKGNRNDVEGKFFMGVGDVFKPDGGAHRLFESLWWQAGRYVEVLVETAEESLTIEQLAFRETRYPLDRRSEFDASDPRLARIAPIMLRGLQMCSHETYMDCPYYEQIMYIGDTRTEVLSTYTLTTDDRLPRKALRMFDASRLPQGITQSRYPSRVKQIIAPFSLWWCAMVHDFALWRGDRALVAEMMPGVRSVIDAFQRFLNSDGFIQAPNGWNYMDWVPAWQHGNPPEGDLGVSAQINWQYAWVLRQVAELEQWLGEIELSGRMMRLSAELADRCTRAFWDESRSLFADDLTKQHFSEHAQCLAILSGHLAPALQAKCGQALLSAPDLARTTIYFTHYYFETCRILGRMDAFFQRLDLWHELDRMGFKTTMEMPEPSRSDCHGWAAHPLYHYLATIIGIRPAGFGFKEIEIRPQLGPLTSAQGTLPHPNGPITVDLRREGEKLAGSITLPRGTNGTLILPDGRRALDAGPAVLTLD